MTGQVLGRLRAEGTLEGRQVVSDERGEHGGRDEALPLGGCEATQQLAQSPGHGGGEGGHLVGGQVALHESPYLVGCLVLQEPGGNREMKHDTTHDTLTFQSKRGHQCCPLTRQ